MKELLSGNEAIARGAYEAGIQVASGYPGTPSTEILEAVSKFKCDTLYCEWAPNEKVGFEVAAGASHTGARALVTMKHVGLNVAADPLMTLAYTGTEGAFVLVVADDPGMHSSQNEQDSRHYARFAKIPCLEPADSQEAKDFFHEAVRISEQFQMPVMLRTLTRVSHSRGLVELGERTMREQPPEFEKNPPRFVPVPAFARQMRVKLEERMKLMKAAAEESPLNRIEWGDRSLGIVTNSIVYQYVREVWPEASVLKLGWSFPFPDAKIREFCDGVERVLIVEELEDILEQHIKALGYQKVDGRNFVPGIGELTPRRVEAVRARMEGRDAPDVDPVDDIAVLPNRPPTLCAGCPHRGMFAALTHFDVVVTGDIGCYALGVLPPLSRLDTILCMGAGISMAHGMQKAGQKRRVVGVVGDSTFFHSGITGLLDIAYNKGASVILVLDNRTTAMTGHQDHPGTGHTLMGDPTIAVSIEDVGRACGIKRVFTVDPVDIDQNIQLLGQELEVEEPTLIVARAACVLSERPLDPKPREIDEEACVACGNCLSIGCPAIENKNGYPSVNELMCAGCGLCDRVCDLRLIQAVGNET